MAGETREKFEDIVVEKLRDSALIDMINDDEALRTTILAGVYEALFQERRTPKQYGYGYETSDSPIVAAARAAAKDVSERIAAALVEDLLKDDQCRKAMADMFVATLPAVLRDAWGGAFDRIISDNQQELARLVSIHLPQTGQ